MHHRIKMVRVVGFEPTRLSAEVFKTSMSAIPSHPHLTYSMDLIKVSYVYHSAGSFLFIALLPTNLRSIDFNGLTEDYRGAMYSIVNLRYL